ncbi:MAG: transglutaminase-like domain-containing protein [Ruminococcus flavefaciens]|nr:transglutaminase-like domain-containing protein [Ruminococcus flavefaciens]MCM1230467.1 transglutaminase-like domain-containing protein [Ruminococcus flavefaciens]
MTETVKNQSGIKNFLIHTLADPVLIYTALIMSSIMYHYREELALTYSIATYVMGWVMFRLFDYMKKHRIIGGLAYIIVLFGFFNVFGRFVSKGAESYPISFMLWFITPQDALQYSRWYTLAIFSFFFIFMASVLYFFTRVQYRVFMTFLIMIIPFAIYAKEYQTMPTGYIIALSVGYIVFMVYFRQLSGNKDVEVIDRLESWKSGIIFTAVFAIIAAIIPKPAIEADRTILETLINADAFTDRLNEMLNVFRDTATGEQFRGQMSDTPLYYARADEGLRLKTTTFSTYDYKNDSWSISDTDDLCYTMTEQPFDIPMNAELCDVLFYVADIDSGFAEKYGIAEYAGFEPVYPELREMQIFSSYQAGTRTPAPQSARQLLESSYEDKILLSRSGAVISSNDGEKFSYNERFRYSYLPDGFFSDERNKSAVDRLAEVDDYSGMLHSAYDIISRRLDEISVSDTDYDRLDHYFYVLNVNLLYDSFDEILLDYGGNERIYNLAQEITGGLESDYDKAEALEWYFINNNYTYDLSYRKEVGENAEDFLFRTKKGVCYEYATAMTLLARASGIPARYCEGFNMQTKYENSRDDDMYVITANDSHGFPELYIKGFGWVTFEPTMTFDTVQSEDDDRQATSMLSEAGIAILGVCIILLLFILAYPALAHRFFRIINNRRKPNEAVAGVIHRVCRLYRIPVSSTSHEAQETVKSISGADISVTALLFDKAEYGGAELTDDDKEVAMREYISAYEALGRYRKEQRRQKFRRKK